MSNPGKFADVAKAASDLLDNSTNKNNYHLVNSFKFKTTSANGVKFTAEGQEKDGGSVSGSLSAEYKHSSGLHLKKVKATTKSTLDVELLASNIVKDVEFSLKTHVEPDYNKDTNVLGLTFTNDNAVATLEADPLNKTVNASLLGGFDSFVAGVQACGAVSKGAEDDAKSSFGIEQLQVAAGYRDTDFSIVGKYRDTKNACCGNANGRTVDLLVDNKFSDKVTFAAIGSYNLGSKASSLAAGAVCTPDATSSFAARVDDSGVISLSYAQDFKNSMRATFSAEVAASTMTCSKKGVFLEFGC